MPNIQFKPHETDLMKLQDVFNKMLERDYPKPLEWNHLELYEHSGYGTPEDWKRFKMDQRVSDWFDQEMTLIAREKIFTLLNDTGKNNSTAKSQQLGQLLNFLKQSEDHREQNKYFVYSFVPLNRNEEKSPNVKILETIPDEIADAIQVFDPNGDK